MNLTRQAQAVSPRGMRGRVRTAPPPATERSGDGLVRL